MSQNVQPLGTVSPHLVVAQPPPPEKQEVAELRRSAEQDASDLSGRRQAAQQEAQQLARYRLVIEGDPMKGFVYKSVDRETGEVISQYPRETVAELGASPGYVEGAVIDTTA